LISLISALSRKIFIWVSHCSAIIYAVTMLVFALVYPNHISKSTSAKGIFGISWIVAETEGRDPLGTG